jgi:outer membrane protein assembly factor BamB
MKRSIAPRFDKARRLFLAAGAAVLAALLLAGCGGRQDWVQFRGHRGQGVAENSLHPPLGVKWKLRLGEGQGQSQVFNPPVVKDDTVYFGSPDGNLYALDLQTGYMRWVFKTDNVINSIPYVDDRRVYVGSNDGSVYAVSRQDGSELWAQQTESTVQSTVMRYQDSVVFASDGGQIYFLTPQGEVKDTLPNPGWQRVTFQVVDNTMYLAPGPPSRPSSLAAYDMENREYLWTLDTQAMNAVWYSFPAITDQFMFMSTAAFGMDNWRLNYYAFDRETGRIAWSYPAQSYFGENVRADLRSLALENIELLDYMAPVVWRDLVIFTSGDSMVRAFDTDDGSLAWQHRFSYATSSAPIAAGGRVYFGLHGDRSAAGGQGGGDAQGVSQGGERQGLQAPRLVALSARNGRLQWEMELDGALRSAPVVAGDRLVFGTDQNMFYVLEELY